MPNEGYIVIDYRAVAKMQEERADKLERLVHHLRHCRQCGEMDVADCFDGRQLWEDALPNIGL